MKLRLPFNQPPVHPEMHPVEEEVGSFTSYARRPQAPPPVAPASPFADDSAQGAAAVHAARAAAACALLFEVSAASLYIASDGSSSAIAKKLPVLCIPQLQVRATASDPAAAAAAAPLPPGQSYTAGGGPHLAGPPHESGVASYELTVAAVEAALQPGQLHTARAVAEAAEQDWWRISGLFSQGIASGSDAGTSLRTDVGLNAGSPVVPPLSLTRLSPAAAFPLASLAVPHIEGEVDALSPPVLGGVSETAGEGVGSAPRGECGEAAQIEEADKGAERGAAEDVAGLRAEDAWRLQVSVQRVAAHLYGSEPQDAVLGMLCQGLGSVYSHGGSAAGKGSVSWQQVLLRLHDSLQSAALLPSPMTGRVGVSPFEGHAGGAHSAGPSTPADALPGPGHTSSPSSARRLRFPESSRGSTDFRPASVWLQRGSSGLPGPATPSSSRVYSSDLDLGLRAALAELSARRQENQPMRYFRDFSGGSGILHGTPAPTCYAPPRSNLLLDCCMSLYTSQSWKERHICKE